MSSRNISLLLVASLLLGCGSEPDTTTGGRHDIGPVQLLASNVTIDWTLRSSEGSVAAEGTCSPVALSYDRAKTEMRELISTLSFELNAGQCGADDVRKDQFLQNYLVSALASDAFISAQVVAFNGEDDMLIELGMNGERQQINGEVEFDDINTTVIFTVPLSEFGLAAAMSKLVDAWSASASSEEGVSEMLEVRVSTRFIPA